MGTHHRDAAATADLAIIATPARAAVTVVKELARAGTKLAVIISAGLHDPASRAALRAAAGEQLRIIGPNCLGVLMPHAHLNASFAPRQAAPGQLGLISQSGALVTAMLDWAVDRHVGFSAAISVGDTLDVDLADLIDLLAGDAATHAILLYIESIGDAPRFLAAARAASRLKPVIAIKAGRVAGAASAATSHTGALAGSYDVHAAAFARAGIVMVDDLTALLDAAQVLCRLRPFGGHRLAMVSNGGGAGVLVADALPAQGLALAQLAPETVATLDAQLPPQWSRANPIDVVGDAHAERFAHATAAALADPNVDGLIVAHCPTAVATGEAIATGLIASLAEANPSGKPVIACWLGTANAASVRAAFDTAHIPLFDNLDEAVRGFGCLRRAHVGQEALLRAPSPLSVAEPDRAKARAVISSARLERRAVLSAIEAKAILSAYGVPVATSRLARLPSAVARTAQALPPPYAVKLVSPDLPHKSDVGGVRLNLPDGDAATVAAENILRRVRREHPTASITGFEVESMVSLHDAVELFAGITHDAIFGPVLAFGAGGKAIEVVADRALGLPPLDDALAGAMIDATRIAHLLDGYRDVLPIKRAEIVRILNALSQIAIDFPELTEIEINPLVASANELIAIDARARVSLDPAIPRLAIRPVPMEWAAQRTTRSGIALHIRPVIPTDETALADLFAHVSHEDLHHRFLTCLTHVPRDRLVPMCQVDYARTINFLAFAGDILVASALLASDPDRKHAELALVVRQDFKGKGIAWTLVEHVLSYAASEKLETVESLESRDNRAAIALEREAGFIALDAGEPSEVLMRRVVTAS